MKVTLKYEEGDDKDLHMTLRLTLPQKYVNGPTREVVKLFVDHYNKKHPADKLTMEEFHIKVVGGNHLEASAKVCDNMATGDECFLLPESTLPAKSAASEGSAGYPAPAANASTPSAPSAAPKQAAAAKPAAKKQPVKDERGRVRCKNFGCQMMFDPDGEPVPCKHHKSPPIFHETAKWWSCCPDRKAYDWDEFTRIPGCTTSFCTTNPEGQGSRRALGGCDVRGQNAPVRLDVVDPNKKMADLKRGLIAIGVEGELFERVWSQIAAEASDPEKVCEAFRQRFTAILNKADL
mmetsp:Transcript_139911/g.241717  ORF Transcript_139911/g.241717 Transcript_139911/m.241717 type:complete len:292 (+) Transcript_139911:54-929(+)